MQRIQLFVSILLLCAITLPVFAQSSWMLAESIDRTSTWNEPFYKPYNSVDKLFSNKADSIIYCRDCNLATILWKGIEANKIPVYQLDKSTVLTIQKIIPLKKKLQTLLEHTSETKTITDALHLAEVSVYRRAVTTAPSTIQELPIEWISITINIDNNLFILYLRAKESFPFLRSDACKWVYPLNHAITMNVTDALAQRNYLPGTPTVVAATNLQPSALYTKTSPHLLQSLLDNDNHTLANNSDTLLIHIQAICSADIKNINNRGFYKVHLPEILLKLYSEQKIKGYNYHRTGYFTPMQPKDLSDHYLVESVEDGEYSAKRLDESSITTMHVLKTLTNESMSVNATNDWLLLGMSKDISTTFENKYIIAFSFEEVLTVLAHQPYMWYNGTNQKDSVKLDEALRTQRIAYDDMLITSMYGDTITHITNTLLYNEEKPYDPVSMGLYPYTTPLIKDFDAEHKRIIRFSKDKIETYQLHYAFTSSNNSVLTKSTVLTDLLLEGIKSNNIAAYSNETLTDNIPAETVLHKLDKARFYQTGNRKKDSIYISKLPVEERYIKSNQLTQYSLKTNYTTINLKGTNLPIAIGVFIPAELNPQYEPETLCYISYPAFIRFLQSNKAYKKQIPQLNSLLNEKAVVLIQDFYDIKLYDLSEEKSAVPTTLPQYIRERIAE
jgi:hypothetical protein